MTYLSEFGTRHMDDNKKISDESEHVLNLTRPSDISES